ncbi:hypothetical protein [Noviherbaspirillum autotrophicum]|nr:hypothetical protein [Noviherbaspirillum autotrophicum]
MYLHDPDLLAALSRQERLGAFESKKYGVRRTSRSSIERVCNRLLSGGYPAFDALRRRALEKITDACAAIENQHIGRKRTREDFRASAAEMKNTANRRLMDCFHLTSAVHKCLSVGRKVAEMDDRKLAVELWKREEKVILAMLTLAKELVVREASEEEKWARALRGIVCGGNNCS